MGLAVTPRPGLEPDCAARRREFIAQLGAAVSVWPLKAVAEHERMRRLGVLTQFAESDTEASQYIAAFRKELEASGWREGQNLNIDYRWAAGDAARMRTYAAEIVELVPDVIFVGSPIGLLEVTQATRIRASCRSRWWRVCQESS
jgi:putative tryptophan/tyrosine transport system substrate-binding protein